MPAGGYLVNVSRGQLIDEDALADSLAADHLAGAALDVFEHEPLPGDSRLRDSRMYLWLAQRLEHRAGCAASERARG